MSKSRRERVGIVYSTSNDYDYEYDEDEQEETLPPQKQNLRVNIDKSQRKGKVVTLITGFIGSDDDLKSLGKELKTKCGTGGSTKDSEILIQGDAKVKVLDILKKGGYRAK